MPWPWGTGLTAVAKRGTNKIATGGAGVSAPTPRTPGAAPRSTCDSGATWNARLRHPGNSGRVWDSIGRACSAHTPAKPILIGLTVRNVALWVIRR